jgi:hypothetical protein
MPVEVPDNTSPKALWDALKELAFHARATRDYEAPESGALRNAISRARVVLRKSAEADPSLGKGVGERPDRT